MIKISDLSLTDKVLEKQYSVVQVSEWRRGCKKRLEI